MKKKQVSGKKFLKYWQDKVNRIGVLRYLNCHTGHEKIFYPENYIQDDKYCCPELWRRLVIVSDGTATLCPRDIQKNQNFGNIKEQTISEIWTGPKMQAVRNTHRKGCYKTMELCAVCPDSYNKRSSS